jgi:hypothetical protein
MAEGSAAVGRLGLPELLVVFVIPILLTVFVFVVAVWNVERRRARRAGFSSTRAYLRAIPRTDEEKKGAIDLAFKGLVICLLGLLFPPLLLIGLLPLFYGARKMTYSLMGLGLVDDPNGHAGRPSHSA